MLADGFYEWQRVAESKTKRPMRIMLRSGEPFAFAGLWEVWRDPAGPLMLQPAGRVDRTARGPMATLL